MAIDVAYAEIGKLVSRLGDGRSRAGTFSDGAAAAAAGNAEPEQRNAGQRHPPDEHFYALTMGDRDARKQASR